MKRIFSIFLTIAMLFSSLAGFTALADTTPVTIYEETFTSTDYYTTEFELTYNGTKYKNGAEIPNGWTYTDVGAVYPVHIQQTSDKYGTGGGRKIVQKSTNPGKTAYMIFGSAVSIAKNLDVTPGYKYTITTTAIKYGTSASSYKPATQVALMHKDANDSYTEIQGADPVTTVIDGLAADAVSIKTDYYEMTYTTEIEITNPNVNAIQIRFGGMSGNALDAYAYYRGVSVSQGDAVELETVENVLYNETFTSTDYYTTEFELTYNGTKYKNGAEIPNGWTYTDAGAVYPVHIQQTSDKYGTGGGRKIVQKSTNPGKTAYMIFGSAVSIAKNLDVTPGYKYTITTTAIKYGTSASSYKPATQVALMHKDANDSYTDINTYLANNNFETSTLGDKATVKTIVDGLTADAVSIKTDYYEMTYTTEIEITDPNVNAIQIRFGGMSGNALDAVAYYRGVKITQNNPVEIIANNKLFYNETFTADCQSTEITLDYDGTSYKNGVDIPAGWTYTTDGAIYPVHIKEISEKYGTGSGRRIINTSTDPNVRCYRVWGSGISLAKNLDIVPGYKYTITTNAIRYGAGANSYKPATQVALMHRNADGSYTDINTYLTNNNYETSSLGDAATAKTVVTSLPADAVQIKTDYYEMFYTTEIEVTDPNVNAIQIRFGGVSENSKDQHAYYRGVKVTQSAILPVRENKRPVAVTYTSSGENVATTTLNLTGAGEVSLRPVKSTVDPTINVVSNEGYFKGWELSGKTYTSKEGKKLAIPDTGNTFTLNALWYAESELVNEAISSAAAQAVTLNNGSKAIRFLALVGADYENYAEAGFVITTLAQNPTVEAGYIPNGFDKIFRAVKVGSESWSVGSQNILSKFEKAATMVPKGITYANVVVANEGITYYATPYVKTQEGVVIYGKTKAASYTGLVALDEQ